MILNIFSNVLLLSMPGGSEWILIILVVLLLFGGKKIPELMRGVGKGMREFNDAKNNVKNEIEEGMKDKEMRATSDDEIKLQELKLQQLREQQAQKHP
ncbi:MAG: twin-arginine translocase TatA/TatE family subunit [Ferruginibacter sp.]